MVSSWRKFDWLLFSALLAIALASLVSLLSSNAILFYKQLVWYIIAFCLILFSIRIDWRGLIKESYFRYGIYWFAVALLLIVDLSGKTIRGVTSWLQFGDFQFEPAELAKLGLILLLAGFFSRRHIAAWVGKNIALSFFYALIPTVLVAVQPDLGSALVVFGIWIGFLLLSGINKKRLAVGFLVAILFAGLLWGFFLKPYQKDRLLGFVNPERDPLGVNYNVIQSKIAIGSAGFWGKGFGAGTQVQFGFLPEAETDFIFAAFVEEWGIVSGLIIILAFLLVVSRIVKIGIEAKNNDYKFITLGTALVLAIHFLLNIGSNLGFLPVTGINFPFLSYGGSNILTVAILVSIVERIKLESS
ncbi:MAG: Rod shape-determining protein [Candidatus Jorgensenbacteria bacterium GW2011_GWA1_48_13]|uniref:Rod shape-determining protein n=2 Tax=Candidatus Joergenseniibacteriota TaxID=1752739 RepID=A0A0G1W829_9BACT|nr:MAG: Rod shape-determining protein [Candidatus Jorgensenbacteria bacterium GW2011_GWA1_48_13]KKU98441.1 MAG: Rod shape-determining protein RodA [Candidatus Jorgensenbacteria bacterium GW2011_GWC1_48_8]KKW14868.1 MAG: Rod shape-determining protein [Candidatus Jorgensenbacteria bacterium GW2011_GWB1_50_10]